MQGSKNFFGKPLLPGKGKQNSTYPAENQLTWYFHVQNSKNALEHFQECLWNSQHAQSFLSTFRKVYDVNKHFSYYPMAAFKPRHSYEIKLECPLALVADGALVLNFSTYPRVTAFQNHFTPGYFLLPPGNGEWYSLNPVTDSMHFLTDFTALSSELP